MRRGSPSGRLPSVANWKVLSQGGALGRTHAGFIVALAVGLVHCHDPTQITLRLYTNVPFAAGRKVVVSAGTPKAPEVAMAAEDEPWGRDGFVGTLVLTPEVGDDAQVDIRVALGVTKDAEACHEQDPGGCIFARRYLSYVKHTSLVVPIRLHAICENVPCGANETCNALKNCVSSHVDPSTCRTAEGCSVPGDPPTTWSEADASVPAPRDASTVADARVDSTMPSEDARVDSTMPSEDAGESRAQDGLVVLYDFKEDRGRTVRDVSGVAPAIELTISDDKKTERIADGGLRIKEAVVVKSSGAAVKVIESCMTSNAITVEAWIKASKASQQGPARIITISKDTIARNVTVGHGRSDATASDSFMVRLRTTATSGDGEPAVETPAGTALEAVQHLVYVRSAAGRARMFVNGVSKVEKSVQGAFDNWDKSFALALGNELTNDRAWLGEYYLVAIYCRELSETEIQGNYRARY